MKFKFKKKSIILYLAFIFLLLTILLISYTFARYVTSFTTKSYIELGSWLILVNSQNILENSDISGVVTAVFDDNDFINPDVIVPTAKGHIDLKINYINVTVPFKYEIAISPDASTPLDDFKLTDYTIDDETFTFDGISIINSINPKEATTSEQNIRLNFEWFDGDGEVLDDIQDTAFANNNENFKYNINIDFTQVRENDLEYIKNVTIGKAINAENYGKKVQNYTSLDPEAQAKAGAWRLFYQDNSYAYLISENKISLGASIETLYTDAGYDTKTGADVSLIGQGLNTMLKKAGGFTSDNKNPNIKAVGYLTDPTIWSKYKNEDTYFAIGGPTTELFIASFNSAGEVAKDGRPIFSTKANKIGYYATYSRQENELKAIYNSGIYVQDTKGHFMFGSPSGNVVDGIWFIDDGKHWIAWNGKISNNYYVRPIVCMKTSVFQQKYESNLVD